MFRFTIRELVLLTAVVGLVLGWGIDRWRIIDAYDTHIRERYSYKHIGGRPSNYKSAKEPAPAPH
jgi:hypothetical protein